MTKTIPLSWETEPADVSFARAYNGEGSYYCPLCDSNQGSVWAGDSWRPTKMQAICPTCREGGIAVDPSDSWKPGRDLA